MKKKFPILSILSMAALALGIAFITPNRAAAQINAPENWTSKNLHEAIARAETRADHLRIAAYYRHYAARMRRESAEHRAWAEVYAGMGMTKPSVANGAPHCDMWSKLDAEAAKNADTLATKHGNIAKEIPE